jgi:hypothetical protein
MTVAEAITKANKASEVSNAGKAISEAFKKPGFESVIDRDLEYLQTNRTPVRVLIDVRASDSVDSEGCQEHSV